jgi:hypothetical protein
MVIAIKGTDHNKIPYFLEVIESNSLIRPLDLEEFKNKIKGISNADIIKRFSINHK